MLEAIKVMRQAASILNEECDRVEHGVVNGGDVSENDCIVVKLEHPVRCHSCCLESICKHIYSSCACGSVECEYLWDIFIVRNKSVF